MNETFILLDDARPPACKPAPARLYRAPRRIITATRGPDVSDALAQASAAQAEGWHVAGQVAYEAGLALEPRLARRVPPSDEPLVWLAIFDGYEEIAAADVPGWLDRQISASRGPAYLSPLRPAAQFEEYRAQFTALQDAITEGDIYQANLTHALTGRWDGDPLAVYAAIRARAAAGYGGVIFDGKRWSLSFSPELFFELAGEAVTLKPMKGTRPRGADAQEDARIAAELGKSEKDRAENLMITDLMRNDISRVAQTGSVKVKDAFAIETYPTVHQMVTTVHARLARGCGAAELLRSIFPCGSITGAPKIRAMELIDEIEARPRGMYCGAIGRLDPGGDAAFNVAIRTLRLSETHDAVLGVGSAIVADSTAGDEWTECLVKGEFVGATKPQFQLVETMQFDPAIGVPMIELHLERLKQSARHLGFAYDRHALRNDIQAFCFTHREPHRLRVLLSHDGQWQLEGTTMPAPMEQPVPVVLHSMTVSPADWRLRHKTTLRDFYDAARAAARSAGAEEALLVRDDGLITEGSFSNLFVEREGKWLTPPADLGLLPGVMRQRLLDEGVAVEAPLTAGDLIDGFYIGNALRGMMKARLI